MPIEPIKIPQNVYIEDRIIGPITLKQIIITAIGCGFSYALFTSFAKAMGGTPPLPITILIWIPGALSVLFAFVKINDLSLLHILLLLIEKANKPTVRTWTPRKGITVHIRTDTPSQQQHNTSTVAPICATPRIDELSSLLDRAYAPDERSSVAIPPMDETEDMTTDRERATPPPVDPTRIVASPLQDAQKIDSIPAARQMPPRNGTISIFRDLSPHAP